MLRRRGLSVSPRFLWECLTSRTVSPFPAPATSHAACGFPRLVKILERPAGQQFEPFQRPLESAIAVGYVFQFSGRSRDVLEDHAELHLRVRG